MKGFIRNRGGAAALELCLLTPTLLFLMIAIHDFGFLLYTQSQVSSAANAGALYAFKLGASGFDSSAISAATTGASYPIAITANPAPYTACGCPNPAKTGLVVATYSNNCSDGTIAGTYVVVSAQATPAPIIAWPGMPTQVSGAVVMRVQ